jgi:hypothetical protein
MRGAFAVLCCLLLAVAAGCGGRSSPGVGDAGVPDGNVQPGDAAVGDAPAPETDGHAGQTDAPPAQADAAGDAPPAQADAAGDAPPAQADAAGDAPPAQTDAAGDAPPAQTDAAPAGDGPVASPECTSASDCTLVNNCCDCLAIGPGENPPTCGIPTCFASTCSTRGITTADLACVAGQCAAGYTCDDSTVVCLSPTPICGAGEVPSVRGGCWGPCVPAEQCVSVSGCAACPSGTFCVADEGQIAYVFHCVPEVAGCGVKPTCACAGPAVCTGAFYACDERTDGLNCSCPVC